MRSVVYSATGDSSVLQLTDRPTPEPGPGDVRVRLVVAGVNPTDWKARAGLTGPTELPFDEVVPGQDGAGEVDAVGDGVTGLAVGDRVSHDGFGLGTVTALRGDGDKAQAEVDFGSPGRKWLVLRYASLDKL